MRNKLNNINSNDGRFHNGDPATGQLGTIVTQEWLNDVQDSLQDMFEELKNTLALARFQPIPAKKNQLALTIEELLKKKVSTDTAETITGEKTFSRQLKAFGGIRLSRSPANGDAGHYADFYADANTMWLAFKGKTFRWHNDGRFSIDNKKFYSELHKPSFADILQKPATLDGYATRFNGVPYIQGSSGWTAIDFGVNQGNWRMEFNPNSHDANERRINFLYRNNGTDTYLRFPTIGTTGQIVAYQSWVDSRIQAIINASPSNLDTLKELADALGNDPNFSRTVINKVGQADTKATNAQTAANKAQTAANNANNNANGRVSKSGDTMTGTLTAPYFKSTGQYMSVSANNGEYAGFEIIRAGNVGAWRSRIEALPDKRWKFWVENSHEIYLPAKGGTVALDHEKVSKSALVGAVLYFATSSAPSGWLKANGAAVSRTTYANLFARIGTTFGAGDGRTTFNLPDLRGEFIRGWDDGRNVDRGRSFGSRQTDALQKITGRFTAVQGNPKAIGNYVERIIDGAFRHERDTKNHMGDGGRDNWGELVNFDSSRVTRSADETRPRNLALLACIKY